MSFVFVVMVIIYCLAVVSMLGFWFSCSPVDHPVHKEGEKSYCFKKVIIE